MERDVSLPERLLDLVGWIVGVIMAIVIGSTLIVNTLVLPYLPDTLTSILGWLIIVLIVLGIICAWFIPRMYTKKRR